MPPKNGRKDADTSAKKNGRAQLCLIYTDGYPAFHKKNRPFSSWTKDILGNKVLTINGLKTLYNTKFTHTKKINTYLY